jgi:hypothetical protein
MTIAATELAGLEDARRQFVDAIDAVPTEALTFLAAGDDYALGGLVTHVNAVLRRYGRVLDAVVADRTSVFDSVPVEADMAIENARSTDGLTAADRGAAMATLANLHAKVTATLAGIDDAEWGLKTPVLYGGSDEPYPTGAAEITGWLTGHYLEHVPHVAELFAAWTATQPAAP